MLRIWVLVALVGCKTVTEKQCDEMFDRYQTCTKTTFTATMASAATGTCYAVLGQELQPGDETSFAAVQKAGLAECAAITGCGALVACFEKHQCRWILTKPGAEPFFNCSQ